MLFTHPHARALFITGKRPAATRTAAARFVRQRNMEDDVMGLLDNVLGGLMGGGNTAAAPMGGVLANLLGGSQGGQMGGIGGGLGGLLGAFEQAGLGHISQSWVGNGPNEPVSPQQLQSVFGESQVNSMAAQAGMQPNDFLSQLSQHLPRAVDGMTPNGRLPDEGNVST